jgi:hypothetical protein
MWVYGGGGDWLGGIRQMLLKWIKLDTFESVHFIINGHRYCIQII